MKSVKCPNCDIGCNPATDNTAPTTRALVHRLSAVRGAPMLILIGAPSKTFHNPSMPQASITHGYAYFVTTAKPKKSEATRDLTN